MSGFRTFAKDLSYIVILLLFFVSCNKRGALDFKRDFILSTADSGINRVDKFEHLFTDSITHKGEYAIYKFVIEKYQDDSIDSQYCELKLYKRDENKWKLLQKEKEETNNITFLDVDTLDLNDDGFADFLYTSGLAARGANRVNSCIIYNPKEENFAVLHNAPNYPSIAYNEKLKCLDSQAIYGGSTTSFLRIQGDSLFCFAEITLFDKERSITAFLPDGSETIILQDTLGDPDMSYFRFSDYQLKEALAEYEDAKNDL